MDKYLKPVSLYMQSDYYEKWDLWLEEVKSFPKKIDIISKEKTTYGKKIEFYFDSLGDAKIYASLFLNEATNKKAPLIVLYHGLGAVIQTAGYQEILSYWLNEGYSVLGMDSRLQGGKSIDNNQYEYKEYGLSAYNVHDESIYYSKYLFQDALMLLELINEFKELDNKPIYVTGGSKGAELALFASSKSNKVALCLADIPSGCYLVGRVEGSYGNYAGLNKLLRDKPILEKQIFKTLSYFDIVHLAREINCPVLASVGSIDQVCPPEFFYQAYRQIPAYKEFIKYDGYGHGGYDKEHMVKKFEFIKKYESKL
ncbi:MAG: acetylxylan esterase [Bacilli bacterium]